MAPQADTPHTSQTQPANAPMVWTAISWVVFGCLLLMSLRYVYHPWAKLADPTVAGLYLLTCVCIAGVTAFRPTLGCMVFLPLSLIVSRMFFITSAFYVGWLVQRVVRRRRLAPADWFEALADVLSLSFIVSGVVAVLRQCPADKVFALYPDTFGTLIQSSYSLEFTYYLVHALVVFRILLMEITDAQRWKAGLALGAAYPLYLVAVRLFPPLGDIGAIFINRIYWEFALAVVLVALVVVLLDKNVWAKAAAAGLAGFFLYLFRQSSSKTVLLGLPLIACAYLWTAGKRRLVVGAGAGLAAVVLVMNLVPLHWYDSLEAALYDHPPEHRETIVDEAVDLLVIKKAHRWYLGRESYLTNSLAERTDLLERGWNMLLSNPLAGKGLGQFYRLGPAYASPEGRERLQRMDNVHNIYLQMAAETGVPTALLFLALLFFSFREALRRGQDRDFSVARRGLCFGAGLFLLAHLADHPMLLHSYDLFLWMVLGYAVAPRHTIGQRGGDPWPRWFARGMACYAALLCIGYGWQWAFPNPADLTCVLS